MKKSQDLNPKTLLIYNPFAGKKRKMLPLQTDVSLEDIKKTFAQYQIPVEYAPTEYAGHATELALDASKKGYKLVIAAGGDGTVGEVLTGLIGTKTTLGIVPLGSFMNVARMLSIPREMEAAIMLLKIGRTRKIDVARIVELGGEKQKSTYFLEESGAGVEARVHYCLTQIFEHGNLKAFFELIKTIFRFYGHSAKVYLDDQEIETKATMVSVSNSPYTGAALHWAPKARLNDHKLTVNLYKMNKWQITKYLIGLAWRGENRYHPKVTTVQATKVRIETSVKRLVHADARVFGTTPVEYQIIPNAVSIVTGFPKDSNALMSRTLLDP